MIDLLVDLFVICTQPMYVGLFYTVLFYTIPLLFYFILFSSCQGVAYGNSCSSVAICTIRNTITVLLNPVFALISNHDNVRYIVVVITI